jgi:hypothetical protein
MAGLGGILDSAGDLAGVLAEIAKGRATGRLAEGTAQQQQGLAESDLFRTQMDAALKGPVQSAQGAAYGDTLANIQPFGFTGETKMVGNIPVPQASGGLTPANFGPTSRQAGADLARLSAGRVNSPSFNLPKPPKIAPLPQSSALDSILNAAGGIGSAAGALGKNGGGGDLIGLAKDLFAKLRGGGSGDTPYGVQPTPFGPEESGDTPYGVQDTPYGPAEPEDTPYGTQDTPYGPNQLDPVAEFEAWLREQEGPQQQGGGEPSMQQDWWNFE